MNLARDRTVQGLTLALGVMLILSALVPSWIVNQLLFAFCPSATRCTSASAPTRWR
jgi:hypothetical protein